ncbi:MAG: hypothetical protein K0R14_2193 [Burkholderiales bacterium]|nr:hypothetical protein [Burkholderiales bacterium]
MKKLLNTCMFIAAAGLFYINNAEGDTYQMTCIYAKTTSTAIKKIMENIKTNKDNIGFPYVIAVTDNRDNNDIDSKFIRGNKGLKVVRDKNSDIVDIRGTTPIPEQWLNQTIREIYPNALLSSMLK